MRRTGAGLVKQSIQLRDLSADKIARLGKTVEKQAEQIARDTGTEIRSGAGHDPPALAPPKDQSEIQQAAASLGPRR